MYSENKKIKYMNGENIDGKKQKYDDYYSNGKVEIGRFGNSVFSKNHYTKEEIQRRNKQFASHYDDIKQI